MYFSTRLEEYSHVKIAHVVSTYPPYHGGMGNVAHAWVEGLRAKGHEVVVLTPRSSVLLRSNNTLDRGLRPWLRWGNAALCPQLLWRLRGFDVIHLHWPFIGGAEFVLAYFFIQKTHPYILQFVRMCSRRDMVRQKLIVTYHMDLIGRGALGIFFQLYQTIMAPLMLRVATFVTVASLDYAEHSWWLRGRKYLVEVPYGVDNERFTPSVKGSTFSPLRSNLTRSDRIVALFVGSLDRAHYFKGLDVLLRAWKELGEMGTRATLRIVGQGDRRLYYEQQARELGIAQHVEFVGAVSWKDLPACYQSADFFVFPSIDASEAFGLVILEAAASGIPAIVSNLPGVRTLVEEGKTGPLVAPGDVHALTLALRRFMTDPESRRVMGKAARRRAEEKYSWDATVDALESIYRLKRNSIDKVALVAIRDRKILMTRSRGKQTFYNPGGKRETGESDAGCLIRECKEELGVTLDSQSLCYYGRFQAQAHAKPKGIEVQLTCYSSSCNFQPRASGEVVEVAYLAYSQKHLTSPVGYLLFDDLKKRGLID